MNWVVNASPIILLAKLNRANLLIELPDRVIIPKEVFQEVLHGPGSDPAKEWLLTIDEKFTLDSPVFVPAEIEVQQLGAGESAVVAFAAANPAFAPVLDDRDARRCAELLGLIPLGTLGVLLQAKKHGKIPEIRPLIETLQKLHGRFSQKVISVALELAGEQSQ